MSYFTQLNNEIEEFKSQSVRVADNYEFKQRETVHNNIRVYNSKFSDGEFDDEGFKKYFKNIVRNPCNSASKAVKFRPKDIILNPAPGQSSDIVWLMNLDFRHWMKEKVFSKKLNQLFRDIPIMGSVVWKKVGDEFYNVDLRNLINEQSADSLKESTYVIEQKHYPISEFRKQKGLWENVDEVIELHRASKDKYVRVVERYGEVTEDVIKPDGDPQKYVYAKVISYAPEKAFYGGKKPIGSEMSESRGQILRAHAIDIDKDFPYREFHWEKIPGRWLGVSRIELLYDPQVRTNEIVNLRVKSSYFSALNIFQSRDDTFKKNLLTEIANGDIISVMDRIERVPTEERNLAAFDLEERMWSASRDENTFNYDVVRGERLPAGTPLGSAQMAAQMVASYFEQIQEEVASSIKELLYNDVIPEFKKQGDHYIKLVGEDLDLYNKFLKTLKLNKEILEFFKSKKRAPTKAQKEAMKQVIKDKPQEEDKFIKSGYYHDVKYLIDIIITGQDKDLRFQSANMGMILQTITADPTVLTDPAKRKIFGKLLESVGLNINEISVEEEQPITSMVHEQKGGGISKPSLPTNMPMGGGSPLEV